MADPATEGMVMALEALLGAAAREEIPPEKLHIAVTGALDGVSPETIEGAVRRLASTYPGATSEGFLLRLLPQVLPEGLREAFARGLTP